MNTSEPILKHYVMGLFSAVSWFCLFGYLASHCLYALLQHAVSCLYGSSSFGQGAQMRDDPGV